MNINNTIKPCVHSYVNWGVLRGFTWTFVDCHNLHKLDFFKHDLIGKYDFYSFAVLCHQTNVGTPMYKRCVQNRDRSQIVEISEIIPLSSIKTTCKETSCFQYLLNYNGFTYKLRLSLWLCNCC